VRVQDAEARCRELNESRERWCARLSIRVLNILRAYDLTFEEAAAMQDAQLLRLPRFGASESPRALCGAAVSVALIDVTYMQDDELYRY
jgi:hypothetical protein